MNRGEDSTEPLLALVDRADEHPALLGTDGDDRMTYAELHDVVERVAGQLEALGIGPGDVVSLSAGNGPGIVAAFLAIVSAGAAAAPLNPAYTRAELESYLADLAPAAMVVDRTAGEAAR